tara:strand:+ start:79 stop:690 length:612 start_codon:yes stop_codon:yes gene_type:complete
MIIGLVGFIGSGKGTVGDILETQGFSKDSFAKPLKDACSIMFGWPREMLEGDTEVSRKWREEPDSFWSEKFGYTFTPRLALQLMGTEAGRNVFHQDVWVISLLNRAKGKDVVVTDVRFKNEINYIQQNGGVIVRVRRGEEPEWYKLAEDAAAGFSSAIMGMKDKGIHQSEWDWVGSEFNYTIDNDGTVNELGNKVKELLQFIR